MPDGTLWVGTRQGVFRTRDGDRFELVDDGVARETSEGADGTLWMTDPAHGARRHGARPPLTGIDGRGMRLLHDSRGNLWVATTGQGLWRVRDSADATHAARRARRRLQTGLSSNAVQSLLEDREGNIWVGTMLGLHSLTPQQLTPLASGALVQTILPDPDGSVWVGTATGVMQFHMTAAPGVGAASATMGHPLAVSRRPRPCLGATDEGLRAFVRGRLVEGPPATGVAPPCSNGAMMSPADAVTDAADRRPVMR